MECKWEIAAIVISSVNDYKYLGKIDTRDECAVLARKERRKANAVKWGRFYGGKYRKCYAYFRGIKFAWTTSKWDSCFFKG